MAAPPLLVGGLNYGMTTDDWYKFIATEYTKILWASWIMMGLSLILGLLYLGSMSHRLGRVTTKEDLRMKVIGLERILLLSQEVSFVVGMMMFGYFLAINV